MSTTRNTDPIEVFVRDQRRRRWSLSEKQALVRRTYEPGMSVSLVARKEVRGSEFAVPVAKARAPGGLDRRVFRRSGGASV